jgi:salicylate hydroxylase
MHVIVIGGGLVGLTTAASLALDGHEVTVIEQAPDIRAAGAGISLWSNALRELDHVGIGEPIRRNSHVSVSRFFTPDGRSVPAARNADGGDRVSLVPRPLLNTLLAEAVGSAHIRLGAQVTGYAEHGEGVTALLADGQRLDGDLLIGADGVYSKIRAQLAPGSDPAPHGRHVAWRAVVPAGDERPEGTVLTVGPDGTRGGYSRLDPGHTMWMINQFDAGELAGTKQERALARARNIAAQGWNDDLLRMIDRTPEEVILENRIMLVPPITNWVTGRVALIGDAAHGLSPHLSAGGTLGIEDIGVLRAALRRNPDDLPAALTQYQQARTARFALVREHSAAIEHARDAAEFAERSACFSHWMITTA